MTTVTMVIHAEYTALVLCKYSKFQIESNS